MRPKRARKTKDWFKRARLVVAAARDRAVETTQQRATPSIKRPPIVLQRRRLAERTRSPNVASVSLFWPSRRPHADIRLRGDARGRDGRVRQELAAGVGRSLIIAQIVAPAFLGHNHRLSKKSHSLPIVDGRIIQTRGRSCGGLSDPIRSSRDA